MKIAAEDLVKRFYAEVVSQKVYKGRYRDKKLNLAETKGVCYSPFRFLRIAIARVFFPKIRMKGLGIFQPNTFQILHFLKRTDFLYLNNFITRERYDYLKEHLVNHMRSEVENLEKEYAEKKVATQYTRKRRYSGGIIKVQPNTTKLKPQGYVLRVDEYKYNKLHKLLSTYKDYETKVPVKKDDLKSNLEIYNSLPRRNFEVQDMVLEVEDPFDSETYTRADRNEN